MARPFKQTVDYFPHYADASDGKTIYILDNEYGSDGYACWFRLLELLCRSKGQYYEIDNDSAWQYLAAKLKIREEIVKQIINTLAEVGAIDNDLFKNKIIWSQNLVDNLSDVYKRRACEKPNKPLCKKYNNSINANSNVDLGKQKPNIGIQKPGFPSQSKVKKSKVNKIKENNTITLPEWIDKIIWLEFLKMRKKMRVQPTEHAQGLIIKDLEKLKEAGDDPNEVLNQSTKNNWKALYPLKGKVDGAHIFHSKADKRKLPERNSYIEPEAYSHD